MTRSRTRTLRTLGSLLSLAAQPCQAAWLAGTAAASRRASSQAVVAGRSALTAATAPTSAFATCDRRLGTCRLSGGTAAAPPAGDFEWRRGAPARMQEVACPTDVEDDPEDMSTQYSPTEVEQRLYNWWEQSGYFKPTGHQEDEKQCFIIPMPPPNVTGRLHMGHAMFVTLEDIMARFQRMRGRPTLWLPGTDHAGIATQMLVERDLRAKGIERKELGREAFLDKVWEWKEEYGGYITSQVRRLGASCDWSRERFTLEPDLCEAVNEAFVRLHEKGLIYRGEYMVNWSPSLGTAVSDLEVDYVEEEGKLYYFKYMLDGEEEGAHIPVATTRPETILGDAAVCVHPEDERYQHLVGKHVVMPMLGRKIPVIADDYVQMDFGTGALKITPAHDINDYAIGKRQKLPIVNIMNKDATLNEVAGPYEGLDRYECRAKLWADMEAAGLTLKVEDHTQRVPRSERSGEVIEPLVSTQWFCKMDGMAAKGLEAVRTGQTQIVPERFEKVYYNWLDNINDWCISRQLWWGHRIPVWYADAHGGKTFVARNEAAARAAAEAELGPGVELRQDEDVLDTWFSSGLWPFATVGWPQQAPPEGGVLDPASDLARFYPASVLETGYDILFFWVARMMMLGSELTGQPPFHTIYMHGLVRDGKGQKMSKTKGNVVDPLETLDAFGTDALRLSLVTGTTPGQDVPLSMEKVTANRNFANKLWNTGRFLLMGLKEVAPEERAALAVAGPMAAEELAQLPLPERWVISRLHTLTANVTDQLESYDFGPAGDLVRSFLWDEYADWYIEVSKRRIAGGDPIAAAQARRTLVYVLDSCLRLLHPFMPYITEELWQRLPHHGESLMVAPWPQLAEQDLPVDTEAISQFEAVQGLVRAVRNARAEYRVEPKKMVTATVAAGGVAAGLVDVIEAERDAIATLARVEADTFEVIPLDVSDGSGASGAPPNSVRLVVQDGLEAYLPLADLMDADKERARLGKQAKKLEAEIEKLEKRLNGKGFADKAPAAVVAKARGELDEQQAALAAVKVSLNELPSA